MNKLPPHDFDHVWNDMPFEERQRLMPHFLEAQILHIWQVKQKTIASHKKLLAELNDWENNIRNALNNYKIELLNVRKEQP